MKKLYDTWALTWTRQRSRRQWRSQVGKFGRWGSIPYSEEVVLETREEARPCKRAADLLLEQARMVTGRTGC